MNSADIWWEKKGMMGRRKQESNMKHVGLRIIFISRGRFHLW